MPDPAKMRKTLRQRVEEMIATECVSKGGWAALMLELLAAYECERKKRQEDEREFQREARDIAAEAHWQAVEETRGGHW